MKLIVCLGNPGRQYEKSRHNAGFLLGSAIQSRFPELSRYKKFSADVCETTVGGNKILFLYPQTFMNLSGQSVQAALAFYKLDVSDLIVIYDDFDIPLGTLRFRLKGSSGTHNGMRSIIGLLGTDNISRLRVGIGPLPPAWRVSDFVLSNFNCDDIRLLLGCAIAAHTSVLAWIHADVDSASRLAASSGRPAAS